MADSLSLRRFLGDRLDGQTPNRSTLSRTRRLIDVETNQEVFTWVLGVITGAGLLRGKTVGVDATQLEANSAMRSIVRRDPSEAYAVFLERLAKESGVPTPTREDLARLDKSRKSQGSDDNWHNPHDPDAHIARMRDGRTHLRGHANILKRVLVHVAGINLSLVMGKWRGADTPRGLRGLAARVWDKLRVHLVRPESVAALRRRYVPMALWMIRALRRAA